MGINIGIDVDGVLADLGLFLRETGGKYFLKKYGLTLKDPEKCHVEEMFGCTRKQRIKFWWMRGLKYIWKQDCMEGSRDSIRRLKDEGNRIVIITSRFLTVDHGLSSVILRTILRKWLKRNRIVYDELALCNEDRSAEDKRAACISHKIDVMVDDSPEILEAVKDVTKAVCFDSPWNKELDDGEILRVKGWTELTELLSGFGK